MDEDLTLHELRRLEAQRKLHTIPQLILETAWVREAQIEAVIDALLAATVDGDAKAYARARQVGEWSARIAAALPLGTDAQLARRVGVLANVNSCVLERIPELQHIAPYARAYQSRAALTHDCYRTMVTIVTVADYFESRLVRAIDHGGGVASVIDSMSSSCDPAVLDALRTCVGANKRNRVAS